MRTIILLTAIAFSLGVKAQSEQPTFAGDSITFTRHHAPRHHAPQRFVKTETGEKALIESKAYDNWYIGVNGGAAVKAAHNKWMSHLIGNAGVRVGRWFTPAFGLALESNAYFSSRPWPSTGTVVQYLNTDLAATINISNWWFGYNGEPRLFEVIAVPAIGMGHVFGTSTNIAHNLNDMTGKIALDFAFNVDKKKSLQVYLEPAMLYAIYGNTSDDTRTGLNLNRGHFQLNAGLVYKFKNTNGTHNFRYAEPQVVRDDSEIRRLNQRLADLEAENERLKNQPKPQLQPRIIERTETVHVGVVAFAQGQSYIEQLQYASINKAAKYLDENPNAKVTITGYASTEGSDELNQKLSEARAEAVKHALITKFGVDPERIEIVGAGATDQYSDTLDYNRVAVFNFSE
ncbi:MAG: OmpA family protein [Prevotella sp.]|nr:OmpA family protein [Prevotella sp.]MCD8288466.1 OmpA family protein [Prevotella sp.]